MGLVHLPNLPKPMIACRSDPLPVLNGVSPMSKNSARKFVVFYALVAVTQPSGFNEWLVEMLGGRPCPLSIRYPEGGEVPLPGTGLRSQKPAQAARTASAVQRNSTGKMEIAGLVRLRRLDNGPSSG